MNQKTLEEIQKRAEAATPGPWMVDTDEQTVRAVKAAFQHIVADYSTKDLSAWGKCLSDIYFIAHSRTDIPALLAEVKRLTEENAKLKKALTRAEDDFTDFVSNGANNPSPYCLNNCEKCVDGRGWCKHGRKECKGFTPSFIQQADQLTHESNSTYETQEAEK